MEVNIKKASLPDGLLADIAAYIEANYIDLCTMETFCLEASVYAPKERRGIMARRQMSVPMEAEACTAPQSLEDILRQADAGFSETLLQLIDKTGKKDSEIYKKAGITKQHFSKIRNNRDYRPTKPTAVALALALQLDLEQTKDFIGRAGYALSNSSKFDLIIRYYIERGNYDLMEINLVLYQFDQPLLFSN
ncbi:MAG: hypothetical protein J6Q54_06835 [Oscillospiraceae bacterium]|nr:hypothetical protein [Oscillospiraceae bacterium]